MNISALRSGNFRVYLSGSVFSTNAMWMLRITIAWVAWDLTKSASFVGLVAFLHFTPTVVVGPLFGVITDRVDVRRRPCSFNPLSWALRSCSGASACLAGRAR